MALAVEAFDSRRVTKGSNPSAEFRYNVHGAADEMQAIAAVEAEAPATFDPWGGGLLSIPRRDIRVERIGVTLWSGVVSYGPLPQTGEAEFEFDTGGGTQHIINALDELVYVPYGAASCSFGNLIGNNKDSVEGVDVTVPVYRFSEVHYFASSVVTEAYKATIFRLTGRVNDTPFKGFLAGECLFLGARGSKRGQGDWAISFSFACSPNETNFNVGGVAVPLKYGWDYLWSRTELVSDVNAGMMKATVRAVILNRVYKLDNLNLLGI